MLKRQYANFGSMLLLRHNADDVWERLGSARSSTSSDNDADKTLKSFDAFTSSPKKATIRFQPLFVQNEKISSLSRGAQKSLGNPTFQLAGDIYIEEGKKSIKSSSSSTAVIYFSYWWRLLRALHTALVFSSFGERPRLWGSSSGSEKSERQYHICISNYKVPNAMPMSCAYSSSGFFFFSYSPGK